MIPFLTTHRNVFVQMQTDKVTNIPCGTSGGVLIYFDKVEVVNRLHPDLVVQTVRNYTIEYDKTWIYDKIHHEINQFCSSHSLDEVYITEFDQLDESLQKALEASTLVWAPGIEIISIRVTKPRIPASIQRNYELMEAEKTRLMVASQHQEVVRREAETRKNTDVIHAKQSLAVAEISLNKRMEEQQKELELSVIANEILLAKEKAISDAEMYASEKESQVNEVLLTPAFLQQLFVESIRHNSEFILGDSIPQFMTISV